MLLTIAIPTYNRNQTLLHNIKELLPQITDRCKLLVLDNCSPTPVEETLAPLWLDYPELDVQVVRQVVNIGLSANILRCFELCDTPWIWLLGDDDPVLPDAVATILQHIEANPEAVLLNFAYDGQRPATFHASGLQELAQKLDRSADLPWISSSVYNAHAFLPHLKFGYQNTYSLLPHIAMLLRAVGESGLCCLSREQIVTRDFSPAPDQQWSLINFALGFPTLLDLPLKPQVRTLLTKKLLQTNHGEGLHIRGIIYQLLMTAIKEGDGRNAIYYFDQICARAFYLAPPARKAKLRLLRTLLRHPQKVHFAFRLLRGHNIGDDNFQDRYERQ